MMGSNDTLRLYSDLAAWWPLFSPPVHYVEEAADLLPTLMGDTDPAPRTLLELGCGGGSLAFHFKDRLRLTLTDRSPQMLEISRAVNPECEHVLGDMRTLNLGREFDRVFLHDAVMYLTDPSSVRAAIATAYRHCRPGGLALFVPDCVKETFQPETESGGEDGPNGRAMRYLSWTWDPDPGDDTYVEAFAFLLRDEQGALAVDSDRHLFGVFSRAAWLEWLRDAGFTATSRMDPWRRDVFVARKDA